MSVRTPDVPTRQRILDAAERLLCDEAARRAMGRPRTLFGDGRAGERIAADLAGEAMTPWEAGRVPARGGRSA